MAVVLCVWAGDKAVQTDQGMHMVYIHAGANPFDTINQAVKYVLVFLRTPVWNAEISLDS